MGALEFCGFLLVLRVASGVAPLREFVLLFIGFILRFVID